MKPRKNYGKAKKGVQRSGRQRHVSVKSTQNDRQKPRTRLSALINLFVLIVLFSAVFALQNLGKQEVADKNTQKAFTKVPSKIFQKTKQLENPAKVKNELVNETEITRTFVDLEEDKVSIEISDETEAKLEEKNSSSNSRTKTFAPREAAKKSRVTKRVYSNENLGWEDQLQSGHLVDMLDGQAYGNSTSTYEQASQPKYAEPAREQTVYSQTPQYVESANYRCYYEPTTNYVSDLDDAYARNYYLQTSGAVNTNNRSQITVNRIENTYSDDTYISESTPSRPARQASQRIASNTTGGKPAWEVNVGNR